MYVMLQPYYNSGRNCYNDAILHFNKVMLARIFVSSCEKNIFVVLGKTLKRKYTIINPLNIISSFNIDIMIVTNLNIYNSHFRAV